MIDKQKVERLDIGKTMQNYFFENVFAKKKKKSDHSIVYLAVDEE